MNQGCQILKTLYLISTMRDVEGAYSTWVASALHGKASCYQHSGTHSRRLNHITLNTGQRVGIQNTDSATEGQQKLNHLCTEAPWIFSTYIFQIIFIKKSIYLLAKYIYS